MSKNVYKQMMGQAVPSAALIHKTKCKMKEEPLLIKHMIKRNFRVAAVVFAVMLMITTTALAAWHLLQPSDVATEIGQSTLASAFDSEAAVNINQSITSGDYTFTLLALVSGKDITTPSLHNGEIRNDRTYVVLAIQKADGSPFPPSQDDVYRQEFSFVASPLVKGLQPWRVNAWTMAGGHIWFVEDGVMYRVIETDNVTMFADRGVYVGVATGMFINNETFIFDENSGEIKANPDYDGSSVVFELPIDKSLADPEKAQLYLDDIYDVMGFNED